MAEVLQGSSLTDLIPSASKAAVGALGGSDDSTPTLKRITDLLQWFITGGVLPVIALLRFSINDGKGQDRHTTSSEDSSSGTSASVHNHKALTTIKQALAFLSFVAAPSPHDEDIRLTFRAAAGPLLGGLLQFDNLLARWFVMCSCDAIGRGVRILEDTEGIWTRSQKDS